MAKPNKSSTLGAMKKYASQHNISVPDKIKKADLYDMLAKKGHVAAPRGKSQTARSVLARRKGKATDQERFNVVRQNLKEMVTGTGAGGARGGDVKLQNLAAFDGTKVRFLNATGQATIRGKAKGSFKLELSDGRLVPMTKSWRPIWSNAEATANKPNGRNKLRWLKKWGDLPKGMTMKKEEGTITEQEKPGARTTTGSKRPATEEEFKRARRGLKKMISKY